MGYVTNYIKGKWGTKTRSVINPIGKITVQTTVTKVLNGNPDRFSYILFNLGANDIYLSFDESVSVTEGLLILSSGGSISMNADNDGELVTYPLFAVANGGTSTVFSIIVEGE